MLPVAPLAVAPFAPRRLILIYLSVIVPFLAADAVWLTSMMDRLYRPAFGAMLADPPVLWAAIAFYLLYPSGILIFATLPALREGSWTRAAWLGALFGGFCYATYDLTNQATLRGWLVAVTLADIGWGMFATGLAATIGYAAQSGRLTSR